MVSIFDFLIELKSDQCCLFRNGENRITGNCKLIELGQFAIWAKGKDDN